MGLSNVDLYEALKKDMSEESARLLVEAVSPERDVAKKADIEAVRVEVAEVREEISALRKEFTRWILAFFLPLWATAAAAIITNLVR